MHFRWYDTAGLLRFAIDKWSRLAHLHNAQGNLMADWAIWVILAGVLIGAELFTGTFYLLMLAIGTVAGALAAYAGLQPGWQLIVAAMVGIAATAILRRSRFGKLRKHAAEGDPNVSMDIGQTIMVETWELAGASYVARVPYRGALWDVDLAPGSGPLPGQFVIREIRGSHLIVSAMAAGDQATAL
jgi:membrane protein implicated in regulation of membrane protease activity